MVPANHTDQLISAADFAARCATLKVPGRYAVAVSGGSDSMALARLAAAHAGSGGADVLALTVDHGLRDGSHEEAEKTARWCKAAGLKHRILKWVGEKPKTGVQAAARNARYWLLCEAAVSDGCEAVLTAHTSDDQAETVFMRLARGSGPRGLAAMAPRTMIASGAGEAIAVIRPLLDVSRTALKATLKGYKQDFVSDPSNDDPAYERIRTRALLAALEEQKLLTKSALLSAAARARQACEVLDLQEREGFARANGVFHQWGGAEISTDFLKHNGAGLLLRQLIYVVSGSENAPGEDIVEKIIDDLQGANTATLGGAMMEKHAAKLWVYREPAALTGRAGVPPMPRMKISQGVSLLWDQRFIVRNRSSKAIEISPLAEAGREYAALFNGPAKAMASVPGIWRDGQLVAAPLSGLESKDFSFKSLSEERLHRRVNRFS